MTPSFTDLLTLSTDTLVARGVPRRDVARLRRATTGHVRPLSERWLRALGRWGRTTPLYEIASLVGCDVREAEDYAKAMGLRWATSKRRLSQATLAVGLWCDRHRDLRVSCKHWGVLPAERMLLCAAAQALLDDTGIETVLAWSAEKLDAEWMRRGLDVSYEATRAPIDLDDVIREARAS